MGIFGASCRKDDNIENEYRVLSKLGKGLTTYPLPKVLKMVFKDLSFALFGLLVSIILAVSINEDVRKEIFSLFTIWNVIQEVQNLLRFR